jgi:hypothetical protein
MSCTNDAPLLQVRFFLEVTVGGPSMVDVEFLPAPCLPATSRASFRLNIPGAGSCNITSKSNRPPGRCDSNENYNRTSENDKGSAAVVPPPDSELKGHPPFLNPSAPDGLTALTMKPIDSSDTPISPHRVAHHTSSGLTPAGSPTPSTIADSDSPGSASPLGHKRKFEKVEGGTGGEDRSGYMCKKVFHSDI